MNVLRLKEIMLMNKVEFLQNCGTWPMMNDFDKFFPVESKSGDGSRELTLVFERNGVKSPKKNVFLDIFQDV